MDFTQKQISLRAKIAPNGVGHEELLGTRQMAGKYKEYKSLNFAQIASEVLEFWKKEKIFEKSVSNREGAPSFTFYEGPPSANGTPGIHHVMGRTVKDIFCRFKTLARLSGEKEGGLGYARVASRIAGRKTAGDHKRRYRQEDFH